MLILMLFPIGIRYGLERAFIENGAENIEIRDVDFNPFTRKFTVHSLRVTEADTALLHIPELTVRLSWLSLFRKRIYLEEVSLSDSAVTVEQSDNGGLRIGGLTLTSTERRKNGTSLQWGIGFGQIEVSSSIIKIHRRILMLN